MEEIKSIEFWTLLILLILVLIIGIKPGLIMDIMDKTSHNIIYSLARGI